MRVLVTGGAGYIGSHAVRELAGRGDRVFVVDSRPQPASGQLRNAAGIVADIRDTPVLASVMRRERIDGVIHFAGLRSVAESMRDPGSYFDVNVGGSIAVLRAMVDVGTPLLVFSSSCSVYGTPSRLPADETLPLTPESPYGASKAAVETMLPWFARSHGLHAISLRYFNAAGAAFDSESGEDWDRSPMLIPNLMKATLGHRQPVDIFGDDFATPDGTAIRDYVHVVDLAGAHVRALEFAASSARGDVIALNLGTGVGSSVRQVIDLVEDVAGRPVPVRWTERRAGDPAQVWADPSRAEATLGWRARHDLREIVETAWAWHSRAIDPSTATG
jgi:UDP-glucose-4-epimerase GalE